MKRACKGFTLIETVISLVLLSFIMIIGYQGLVFGLDQWQKGHERMQGRYDYHQAIGWMRDKLGSAENLQRKGGDNRSVLFDGKTDSVEFLARYDRARSKGLYVSKIFLNPDNHRLYVSYYLHHPDIAGRPENIVPQQVALLSDIASAKFAYYGRQPGSKKTGWHSSWPQQSSLPRLLRVDIETLDGGNYRSLISILSSNNA